MHFTRTVHSAGVALLAFAAAAALAQSPYIGKWKLDPSQSQLTGDTLKFAADPSGGMTYSSEGHGYTFKTDGKPVKTYSGADVTWKQMDDHTWQSHAMRNGTDLGTTTWTLAPDGSSLTVQRKGTRPDGSTMDDTSSYARVDGQSGLAGTWRSKDVKMQEDIVMEFQPDGPDGLIWMIPAQKATVHAKMDGKDYPAVGPTVPDGLTLSLTPSGPNSFKVVEKLKGEEMVHIEYTLSDDGKTLTDTGSPAKVNEPFKEVWNKQS